MGGSTETPAYTPPNQVSILLPSPPAAGILCSTHLESSQEWLRRLTQSSRYQENGHLKKKSYFNKFGDKTINEFCPSIPTRATPLPNLQQHTNDKEDVSTFTVSLESFSLLELPSVSSETGNNFVNRLVYGMGVGAVVENNERNTQGSRGPPSEGPFSPHSVWTQGRTSPLLALSKSSFANTSL